MTTITAAASSPATQICTWNSLFPYSFSPEANRLLRCKAYVDIATGEAVVQNRGKAHDDTVDIIATHLRSIVASAIG